MKLYAKKTLSLSGNITPPSSKSQSIRGVLFGLLAQGTSTIRHMLDSTDTQNALNAAKQLGANLTFSGDTLQIESQGLPLTIQNSSINTGNSGITTLFLMPLLGLRNNPNQPILMDCGEQMRLRPVLPLVKALRNLGMSINFLAEEGRLPAQISGELIGGETEVDGSVSQYLSALLMALPCAKNDSTVKVHHLSERPYVEMTLEWLKNQGIQYTHENIGQTDIYKIKGHQHYSSFQTTLSGDYSSASMFIAAGALLPGCIQIEGLNPKDAQGDKKLISILRDMGASIEEKDNALILKGGKPLQGITIDAGDTPDLLPALAVIGTFAQGKTQIQNIAACRVKETDRIHSMKDGLSRMGALITDQPDSMTIHHSTLNGAEVKGYGDHRTVMALGLAGMLASGTTVIDESESVKKTFPTYVQLMKALGADMEEKS